MGAEAGGRLWPALAQWPGTSLATVLLFILGVLLLWRQNRPLPVRNTWGRALGLGALASAGLVFLDVQVGLARWVMTDVWGRYLYWAMVPLLAAVLIWRFRGKHFASVRSKVFLIAAGTMAPLALLWLYLALLHFVMTTGQLPDLLVTGMRWVGGEFKGEGALVSLVVAGLLFCAHRYSRFNPRARLTFLFLSALSAVPAVLWALYTLNRYDAPDLYILSLTLCLFSLVAGILTLLVNVNMTAPHRFYRDRLSEAYVFRLMGDTDGGGTGSWDDLKLSQLVPGDARRHVPYPLINATMNVSRNGSDKHKEKVVRSPEFFLFSPLYVGSELTGYRRTTEMESRDPHLNLPTAMAISGAAASSNMGDIGLTEIRILMTVLNLRLGYWLPNPAKPKVGPKMDSLQNLLLEMWGGCPRPLISSMSVMADISKILGLMS